MTIKNTIEDSGIRLYENCINVVYDSKGIIYEIPNYCINEPFKYEEELDLRTSQNRDGEKIIKVKFCIEKFILIKINFRKQGNIKTIEVRNTDMIIDVKRILCRKFSIEKVRLFSGGKELIDENRIMDYRIFNNNFVEVL